MTFGRLEFLNWSPWRAFTVLSLTGFRTFVQLLHYT